MPYAYTRPDETAITGPAVAMLSGDLRPPDFLYPSFFYYAVALVYAAYYLVTRPFAHYASLAAFAASRYQSVAPFFYLSRSLSAVMGALTVWWVFAICRRVFDETVALVAALFMALAYLHVRDSHFATTDVTMTALIVLSVLAILRWQDTGDPWRAAVAGLTGGLAASTKYNGLGVVVPFAVAAAEQHVRGAAARGRMSAVNLRRIAASIAGFGTAFAVAFFGGSPYILPEWPRFVAGLTTQGAALEAGHGMILSRGWWYHASVTLPAALGWPMYVAAVAGIVLLLTRRFRQTAVIFAFPVAYYIVAGSGYRVFARYIIPVLPFLCMSAAWTTVALATAIVGVKRRQLFVAATTAAAVAVVLIPARNVVLLDRLLTRPDNRLMTAQTLVNVVPPGSLIYESGGSYGRLPFDVADPGFTVNQCEYDESTGQFSGGRLPDWLIVQRSPLVLYSNVPAGIERLVQTRYVLTRTFVAQDPEAHPLYDQQDAFFLPLNGLAGMRRPGPNFEVYRLRGGLSSTP